MSKAIETIKLKCKEIGIIDNEIFVLLDELDIVREIIKNKMENVYSFEVPLKVEIETGTNWYEAK